MNLFWTFQGLSKPGSTHYWHRDIDDFNFLALFVYLTDVDENGGKFQFIKKSHSLASSQNFLDTLAANSADPSFERIRAEEFFPPIIETHNPDHVAKIERNLGSEIEDFAGPAGTAFFADTYGLHRGSIPHSQDRLACWIRFGLVKNLSYIKDQNQPTSASDIAGLTLDSEIPWSFRLLVKQG
jgi:hypothetical protein